MQQCIVAHVCSAIPCLLLLYAMIRKKSSPLSRKRSPFAGHRQSHARANVGVNTYMCFPTCCMFVQEQCLFMLSSHTCFHRPTHTHCCGSQPHHPEQQPHASTIPCTTCATPKRPLAHTQGTNTTPPAHSACVEGPCVSPNNCHFFPFLFFLCSVFNV